MTLRSRFSFFPTLPSSEVEESSPFCSFAIAAFGSSGVSRCIPSGGVVLTGLRGAQAITSLEEPEEGVLAASYLNEAT